MTTTILREEISIEMELMSQGAPDIDEAKGFFEFAGNLYELVNTRLKFPTEGRK